MPKSIFLTISLILWICLKEKKSIYTNYWEVFFKSCWLPTTSDAFNGVFFLLPDYHRLLTSPRRGRSAFVSCASYPLNFLLFLIYLSPFPVSQDLVSFPFPSFSLLCTCCVQSRGEHLGFERGQDLFSASIMAQEGLGFFLQPLAGGSIACELLSIKCNK